MKEITKQRTVDYTVYQAEDGTEFSDRRECEIYDNSALGILFAKLKNITLREDDLCDIFNFGLCDLYTHVIIPKTLEDIETIQRIYSIVNHTSVCLGKEHIGSIILMHIYWNDNDIDSLFITDFNKCVEYMLDDKFTIVKKTETVKKKK